MKPIICELKTTYCDLRSWIIGLDEESIIEYFINENDCELEEVICTIVPEEQWNNNTIIDPDCNYDSDDYQDGDEVIDTFAGVAAKFDGITDIIACEYD